jgi:site-specific DNA-methyltransferase (adenine-specific)
VKPSIKCNDNLSALKKIPDESVDLVYIDPPFFTQEKKFDFNDSWSSMDEFKEFMKPRFEEVKRVLKKNGSVYLHSDHHANSYLRLLMDETFGYNNLQNEIIWVYSGANHQRKKFGRKHDTIYFYTKSKKDWTFNADDVRQPYREWAKGKKSYTTSSYGVSKPREIMLDERGKLSDDWWYIPPVSMTRVNRTGYSTQKPEPLLEKIIKASSNEGDLILDIFAGSGTTCAVAKRLGRNSICIDKNPKSCKIMEERLR